VAIALLCAPVALAAQSHLKAEGAAQNSSADERGTERAPLVVKEYPAPRTPEEAAAEKRDHDEQRANDRNMVAWTRVLAAVGVLQLLVFGYQALKLRETVIGSEDAIKASQRSAKAAEESLAKSDEMLSHAREAAVHARESEKRVERAYVFAGIESLEFSEDNANLLVGVTVINAGKTPAEIKEFAHGFIYYPIPAIPPYEITARIITDVIFGANTKEKFQRIRIPPPDDKFIFFGFIRYIDIFGDEHISRYCMEVDSTGQFAVTAGDHEWNRWD